MITKHETRKKEILESAFRIWGKCRYLNTSLSDLASDRNLTKQALYRYFPSKEKIESAMEEAALEIYRQYSESLITLLSDLKDDDFIRTYTNRNIEFVSQNRRYLGFLAYRYRGNKGGHEFARRQMDLFSKAAMERAGIPSTALRYLNSLTFMIVHRKPGKEKGGWEELWNEGFCSRKIINQPDYDGILQKASELNFDIFKDDPLMQAVVDTVMEEAGNEISLGKVARKAGLTKSSLYNYWPGKEAMLTDVLNRQTAAFGRLFEDFTHNFSRPEDLLFAYLAFIGTFLSLTPEILNYLQRVMSYGIRIPHDRTTLEKAFLKAMNPVLESNILNLHGYSTGELFGLVNLAGVNEVKYHLNGNPVRVQIEGGLKDLYLLIMGGIPALRRTMK